MSSPQSLHNCLIGLSTRAERVSNEKLVETFVDAAPLFNLLNTINHQVIFGRRGTGKTHALKYLGDQVRQRGEFAVYIDLRSVGSNGSIYADGTRPLSERATTLLLDVLREVHDGLLEVALANLESIEHPDRLSTAFDAFAAAVSTVRIVGETESEVSAATETETGFSVSGSLAVGLTGPSVRAGANLSNDERGTKSRKTRVSGHAQYYLQFGAIQVCLEEIVRLLDDRRVWILIDEWSEVPLELQPYLADLLRRAVLPLRESTVKVAAIEHRSSFAIMRGRGEYIGIELGADVGADLNLDDFMVFDNDQGRATEFFKKLLYKHYASADGADPAIDTPTKLIHAAFTQTNVFEEFVRAAEGVPRDAIYLISTIAQKAYGQSIAMQHVRTGARDWYQRDKAKVIRSNPELNDLLIEIIEEVIGHRRARAFLFRSDAQDQRIDDLFDSRLFHILKKNISSHDEPGVRYDAYKLDYGCYVDLISTTRAPLGLLPSVQESDEGNREVFVDVPPDDYRSIRRAILTLNDLSPRASVHVLLADPRDP
jgi:hypothetical protein